MSRIAPLGTLLLLLALTGPSWAQTIDYMEEGPFSLQAAAAPAAGSQVVTPASCVANLRNVTLTAFPGPFGVGAFADLSVAPAVDDEIQMVFAGAGGQLDLRYTPGDVDLTSGGIFNRLEVSFSVAVLNGRVEVKITDITGESGFASLLTSDGAHTLSFDTALFAPADLTHVQDILITLVANEASDYHLRDIRMSEVPSQEDAAGYVIDQVLGGAADEVTLWTHDEPLDNSHVARHHDRAVGDIAFPYALGWLFMVDDMPDANWGHPVRWVFVKSDLSEHVVYERDWLPAVITEAGQGTRVPFGCIGATSVGCVEIGPSNPGFVRPPVGLKDGCLYAVLISGGWTTSSNYSRYAENLTSMYNELRGIGYAKSQIYVYYADGTVPLDLDNEDGDDSHFTGSDVTDGAFEAAIRGRISSLCDNLDPDRDVLFIYTSNHGASNGSLMLWDFNMNGNMEDLEGYSPAEYAADTSDCQACRTFAIFDQCFSGAFTPIANDGNHPNTAIYAAALANQVSYGREYMDWWEDQDIDNMTMNALHASVVNSGILGSTAIFSETVAGQTGNVPADYCWGEETFYVPSDLTFCGGSLETSVLICNELPSTQYFDLEFTGLPAGSGCNVPGPNFFQIGVSTPIAVGPGQCVSVPVTIGRPAGLEALGDTACYEAKLTNLGLGYTRTETGHLRGTIFPFLCMEIEAESHPFLLPEVPVTIDFLLTNEGPSSTVPYQWEIHPSDGMGQNTLYGVNDMLPGEVSRGEIFLPEGETVQLSATVLMYGSSNLFADLQFVPTGVGKKAGEPLFSFGLRGAPEVTTAVDPTPVRGAVDLKLHPNPFNPRTTIAFELDARSAGPVTLTVLDARGRRVRSLIGGEELPAGPQRVIWSGEDDAGQRVASGAYFMRLETRAGVTVRRAALLK